MRDEFDKLLLAALVVLFCGLAWWGYGHNGGASLASFSSDQARTFGGALLALITGQALRARAATTATEQNRTASEPSAGEKQ